MRVLVVGSGAREHAIVWKLAQSPLDPRLIIAPGNAGTAQLAENVAVEADDLDGLLELARRERADLTVVGPEVPLAAGIVDRFHEAGLLIFGPTEAAARIETSKSFAKDLMSRHAVPTGSAAVFDDYDRAAAYVDSERTPIVVKADGLTAGKGVTVAESRDVAKAALRNALADGAFGASGEHVLIEEFLEGWEVSVFAFVDGTEVSEMVAACDYKRVGDGDTGPNTGGMGAFSPPLPSLWTSELQARVRTEIMEPVARGLAQEGSPYSGVLYAGLMITSDGPKVIEFNCRMGDPETQVVLPRLKTDLLAAMISTAEGRLQDVHLEWDPRPCVGVVVASGGYPGPYRIGVAIEGLEDLDEGAFAFHAATALGDSNNDATAAALVSSGGRVLTVSALGDTLAEARSAAYSNVARVSFEDAFYRKDIAAVPQ